MWRCEPVQHFETVNELKTNSFSLREKERIRGQFKIDTLTSIPLRERRKKRSNFRYEGTQ